MDLSPNAPDEKKSPQPGTAGPDRARIIWVATMAVIFVVVFCVGFVYFYRRQQSSAAPGPVASGRALPKSQLTDDADHTLTDNDLRHGKLILVFITPECDACMKESQFLRTVINKRSDIPFYGVISFGDKQQVLGQAKERFPFKVFFDEHFQLAGGLGIRRVPIKLFVEDGVIKKSWGGATVDEQAQAAFVKWLEGV